MVYVSSTQRYHLVIMLSQNEIIMFTQLRLVGIHVDTFTQVVHTSNTTVILHIVLKQHTRTCALP